MDDAHYVPETDPIVGAAKELWQQVHRSEPTCAAVLCGSYAHFVDGAVAIGLTDPGLDTNLHGANEYLPMEYFEKMVKLWTLAILRLCSEKPF